MSLEEQIPKTPLWQRKEFWLVVGIFIVIIVLLILAAKPEAAPVSNIQELPQMVGGC